MKQKPTKGMIVSLGELQTAFGASRRHIYNLVEEGMARREDKKFDLPACIEFVIHREVRKAIAEGGGKVVEADYEKSRAELTEHKAAIAKVDRAKAEGEVVDREEQEALNEARVRAIVQALSSIETEFAGRVNRTRAEDTTWLAKRHQVMCDDFAGVER